MGRTSHRTRRVLITGIAGGQGRLVARNLLRRGTWQVSGLDRVRWQGVPEQIRYYVADVRKKKTEDIIRTERPEAIVHLAFVRHFSVHPAVRHEVNVAGTKRLIEFAIDHGVRQIVVGSSSYVYGALPENPYYMDESFPLNVSRTYPEVRDLAEVDMLATGYLWRNPEVAISILRPVNVLGRHVHSAIGRYLSGPIVPTVLGFDPMMQFLHEEDLTEAIVLCLEKNTRGAFNVVGPDAVPLSVAIRESGGVALPLPELLLRPAITALFRAGIYPFPPGVIDFAKYPCTLDGTRFREATGFRPRYDLRTTLRALRG